VGVEAIWPLLIQTEGFERCMVQVAISLGSWSDFHRKGQQRAIEMQHKRVAQDRLLSYSTVRDNRTKERQH